MKPQPDRSAAVGVKRESMGAQFAWMDDMPPWAKDMRDMVFGVCACLLIAVPMLMMKHKSAMAKVQNKMD